MSGFADGVALVINAQNTELIEEVANIALESVQKIKKKNFSTIRENQSYNNHARFYFYFSSYQFGFLSVRRTFFRLYLFELISFDQSLFVLNVALKYSKSLKLS